MKYSWLRTVFPIASIFSFRLLGLFMLIPVFTIQATTLTHATPLLIGFALGGYGLSQGLLQIPFGLLSDHFGRKPMITIGLILFIIGSLLGAYAQSIEIMILARIIQGAGAIGSVLIALLAELTEDTERVKAMAIIGVSVGISFSLAMVISPMLVSYSGLSGIFIFTAYLALLALILLHTVIPTPKKNPFSIKEIGLLKRFQTALLNRHLQQINISIFFQHLILTSTFYALPLILKQQIQHHHLSTSWHFYLPIMVVSFIFMLPMIAISERRQQTKTIFLISVVITTLMETVLIMQHHDWNILCGAMLLYFIAFNFLEASLPSMVSRQADIASKGAAMGIYSSSQFLGIFAGGATAGAIFELFGIPGIFVLNSGIGLIWIGIAAYIQPNTYQLTHVLSFTNNIPNEIALLERLHQIPGVKKVSISHSNQQIYLQIAKDQYVQGSAEAILQASIRE